MTLRSLDRLSQTVLPILVVSTLLLIAKRNRWGFVVGLATQPLWFLTYWLHRQWGGLVTVAMSTVAFLVGVREWFAPSGAAGPNSPTEEPSP